MEDIQGFAAHLYCQHQNVAKHKTEKSIFTAAGSTLFSAVQYWGWFTWVWYKFNVSIKLLNGAEALCICRYDHTTAGQTTAFWPKPRSQTRRILTWFGKSRVFICWPVLIIYGGQFELAKGLVGIIQVPVILKFRQWVCSHGPQILQFILQCLEHGLQRLLGETQRLQIYLPTEVLPLLTDVPPILPYLYLSRYCFSSPLIQVGTPRRRHYMSDSFMPIVIKAIRSCTNPLKESLLDHSSGQNSFSLLKHKQQDSEEGDRLHQPLPDTLPVWLWAPPPSEQLAQSPAVSTVGPVLEAFPRINPPSFSS